jgi:hypothetical protein
MKESSWTSIADNDYQMKSCIMVEIGQLTLSAETVEKSYPCPFSCQTFLIYPESSEIHLRMIRNSVYPKGKDQG